MCGRQEGNCSSWWSKSQQASKGTYKANYTYQYKNAYHAKSSKIFKRIKVYTKLNGHASYRYIRPLPVACGHLMLLGT